MIWHQLPKRQNVKNKKTYFIVDVHYINKDILPFSLLEPMYIVNINIKFKKIHHIILQGRRIINLTKKHFYINDRARK